MSPDFSKTAYVPYERKSSPRCLIMRLVSIGLPASVLVGVRNKEFDYCESTYEHLTKMWSNNMPLINLAGRTIKDSLKLSDSGRKFAFPVASKDHLPRAQAFVKFLKENESQIYHLYITVGDGANPDMPVLSTAFNHMSFAERQKYMQAYQNCLEEVKEEYRNVYAIDERDVLNKPF